MADPIDTSHNGKIVSFNIFAASALGGNVKNGTVEGIVSWSQVSRLTGQDPAQMHAIAAPEITGGAPASYKDYNYVLIRSSNDSLRAIGMAWIDGAVTVDQEVTFTVTVRNRNLSDEAALRALLLRGGFTDITITSQTLAP